MSLPEPAADSIALVTGASSGIEELGANVDVLVNNAGFGVYRPFCRVRQRERVAAVASRRP